MTSKSNKEVPLAKNSEFLNGKRSQVSMCAPIFKREIENLGNASKITSKKLKERLIFCKV